MEKMKRIVVIDDDPMNRKLAEYTLVQNGYDVESAGSGQEGIEVLKKQKPDVVLLDFNMPGLDGMETLEEMKKQLNLDNTKVIFLTSASFPMEQGEMKKWGVTDVILKPLRSNELLGSVKKALLSEQKDKMLVVDDEKMNLMLAKRLLGTSYDVECVTSGTEALEYLLREKPAIILLDLHMPHMNGLEVLKILKEDEKTKDIPVIFLTADGDKETEAQIFKAGAMDYIQKPLVAQVAIQRINRIIELRHLQSSLMDEVEKKTRQLEESQRKIENLSMQIMLAMTGAIDAKDKYTNGHSNRVAKYSRELAIRMGKTSKEIDNIYCAALLHDIGKIGVSNDIINKASKLTDEEYAIMKSHSAKGANILSKISEMPELSIGAHWHHERYDGKGYPDGLKGKEIHEIARIIGVADAYDAMSSNRSYRKALPQEVVRSEIEKGKGVQFDPEIAELMLRMIDEDVNYDMREK